MTTPVTIPAPVEKKVKAATIATYFGSVAILAILGAVSNNPLLISGLPDWIEAIVIPVIPALVTFFTAYRTKHTPRP
jgi:hypothetical protein